MDPPSDRPSKVWLALLLVAIVTGVAFANSFSGPFIFDGLASIEKNTSIHRVSESLSPPPDSLTVSGRPLLNLSLALNYALDERNPRGYHLANLLIHVLAALALFGILRRTLLQPALRPRFGDASLPLASAIAILWAVHPLQTESVTYVVQRAESLMGLFYFLTIYCFIRATEENARGLAWPALAVIAALCGMATKEVMITAPLMALLYDRTFVAGTFRDALAKRWRFYLALASTWILLAWLILTGAQGIDGTGGFSPKASWHTYALGQAWAIAHYLRLAIWPHPLVLDYGGKVFLPSTALLVPAALLVGALLTGTVLALRRRPAIGFAGCWFFGILALTSSVIPLGDMIVEHRLYLPLAALIALPVLALHAWLGKRSILVLAAVALTFTVLTLRRNADYATALSIWSDTVAKRPSARGFLSLGNAWMAGGQMTDAIESFSRALEIDPDNRKVHANLGKAYQETGRLDEALTEYQKALAIDPAFHIAHNNLGSLLARTGRPDEAIAHYRAALESKPDSAEAHNNLGNVFFRAGNPSEAAIHYRKAVDFQPQDLEIRFSLGGALYSMGQSAEAIPHLEKIVASLPNKIDAVNMLAWILATCPDASHRDGARSVQLAQQADSLAGGKSAPVIATLAAAFAEAGLFEDAVKAARKAIAMADSAGNTAAAGQWRKQLELYEKAQPYRDRKQLP